MLKLALSSVIYVLPVVVNNEACYFNVALRQLIDGVEDFFVREALPKGIPCTFRSRSGCAAIYEEW
jgi:hypothetical protein